MKQVSSEYKNEIKKLGRQMDSIITYYNHYKVITENDRYILTEDGEKILTEQINRDNATQISSSDIYNTKVIIHGDLLKSMMKEFDFEIKQDISINSIVNYKFGIKTNDSYEYIDCGDFIVYEKEYKEDTQTYKYKSYDSMLFTMIPFVAPNLSEYTGTYTMYNLIEYICEFCNLQVGIEMFPNSEREIQESTLKLLEESNLTFRDVLDYATETTGCSSWVEDNALIINSPTEVSNNLPSEYTQVEYIESTGTQYIDTGISPTLQTGIKIKAELVTNANTDKILIGSRSENTRFWLDFDGSGGNKRIFVGYGSYYYTYIGYDINNIYNITFNYNGDKKVIVNNSSYTLTSTSPDLTNSIPMYIFRANYTSPITGNFKVYSCQLFEGETMTRNFIPCYRNSDNEVGMYDLVSNTFYINNGTGEFIAGNEVVVPFDASYFKDADVNFGKVYGPINSVLFSRSEDTDIIEIKDDDSIKENGVTQIVIKDNPFLEGNDRSDYQEELFEVLNGLTYTLNDVSTTGITYLDYYDKYKVNIRDNDYTCLLLNTELNVSQGFSEKIFTEAPEQKVDEYRTSRLSDKGQKWANIQVKKDLAEISLEVGNKVGNDEIISKINLSPEQAEILSNKISLQGKTINLTSDLINIASTNFSVDTNGHMACTGATITGGDINLVSVGQNSKFTITDSVNSNASWSQSARKITWNGLNGGLLEMTNYLPGGGTIVCKSDDNTQSSMTAYEVKAPTITQTSHVDKKKNFKKFENALDILKDVDIYSYNFKFEENYDKKHIGFIIGDNYKYRRELTDKKNENVELYSMISVLWKAVQEQQEAIERLKERIGK